MATPRQLATRARSAARRQLMQALYQWQLTGQPWQDVYQQFAAQPEFGQADAAYFREALMQVINAKLDGQEVAMTQKDYELTVFLLHNLGRLLSRGHILEAVWGQSAEINTRTVDTHVSRIRGKLQLTPENGWRLSAVYQHGYRLERVAAAVEQ